MTGFFRDKSFLRNERIVHVEHLVLSDKNEVDKFWNTIKAIHNTSGTSDGTDTNNSESARTRARIRSE